MIDAHIHIDNRNRENLELMALAGLSRLVGVSAYLTSFSYDSRTLFDYFERLLKWEIPRCRRELIDLYIGVGVSMVAVPTDWEKVIERLPEYFAEDRVVCIGECGLDPKSKTCPDMGEQEELLKAQMRLSAEYDFPMNIHTPDNDKLKWAEKYLKLAQETGVKLSNIILDHQAPETVPYVLEMGFNAGITVQPCRGLTPAAIARFLAGCEDYERITLDSDCSQARASDSLSVPLTVHELKKLGAGEDLIEAVAWKNANRIYRIPE